MEDSQFVELYNLIRVFCVVACYILFDISYLGGTISVLLDINKHEDKLMCSSDLSYCIFSAPTHFVLKAFYIVSKTNAHMTK